MTFVLEALPEEGVIKPLNTGAKQEILARVKLSGNYPAGGEPIGAELEAILKEVGLGAIDVVYVTAGVAYQFEYNYTTNKLQVYQTGAAVKGAFEELPAAAYPAVLTEATTNIRLQAIGQ